VTLEHAKAGRVPLCLYRPAERRSGAALFWIHGGGYLIGRPAQDDRFCAEVAAQLGIMVVSVGYRLAPEHPFPAPLEDCHAGWAWLQRAAPSLGIDPRRVAIGGQSAGGGLAACLVHKVQDEGPGKAAAQWLFCPMLDDRTAARRDLDAIGHRLWGNADNAVGWRAYLAAEPGGVSVPPCAVAARREDLARLPPAWIGVGDVDLFAEEDRAYAERLSRAGVKTTFVTVPGAPHGFEAWAPHTEIARRFLVGARDWLADALDSA
jgi:acetyl esterase/lipase